MYSITVDSRILAGICVHVPIIIFHNVNYVTTLCLGAIAGLLVAPPRGGVDCLSDPDVAPRHKVVT